MNSEEDLVLESPAPFDEGIYLDNIKAKIALFEPGNLAFVKLTHDVSSKVFIAVNKQLQREAVRADMNIIVLPHWIDVYELGLKPREKTL